ncbi:hypothetical protein Tco_0702596 [Tanacetum coccineum]|uniref:Uncharacterized protein n=1 Tax=Tanacetum coccineum TaxID=301880 RepID=A0ABQ4XXH3_9ASTR
MHIRRRPLSSSQTEPELPKVEELVLMQPLTVYTRYQIDSKTPPLSSGCITRKISGKTFGNSWNNWHIIESNSPLDIVFRFVAVIFAKSN